MPHPFGIVGMRRQPGLHARAFGAAALAVEPGAQAFVVEAFVVHRRHTTLRSAGATAALPPSSRRRSCARARQTRDITVPTGMPITSATSA